MTDDPHEARAERTYENLRLQGKIVHGGTYAEGWVEGHMYASREADAVLRRVRAWLDVSCPVEAQAGLRAALGLPACRGPG